MDGKRLIAGIRDLIGLGVDGNDFRVDRTAALVTQQAHGRYQEAALSGRLFVAPAKSITVTATTDIDPLPATTGRAIAGVFNPGGSGKNLAILKVGFATVSGTPGGPFYLNGVTPPTTVAVAASIGNAPFNLLTMVQTGSVARGLAGTVIGQSAIAGSLRTLGGPAAIAAGAGNYTVDEEIAGAIIVPPGGALTIQAHATGTSHVVSAYVLWEEMPV